METIFTFPQNFLWGAATSSHQVEGENTNNDWWEWEQAGRLKEPSGPACDHWRRFEEDFVLAQSLNHSAHRFSLEWSRIEPRENQFDAKALDHYLEVIRSLREKELEPVVTLHHFTLPAWLAQQGGWLSAQTPKIFGRYVENVVKALGSSVRFWITLNEPVVQIFKGYLMGEWPPGEKSYEKALQALRHLLKGHAAAYEAIHRISREHHRPRPSVGIAKHVLTFTPCSTRSWKDRLSVRVRHLMFNHLFVKALTYGRIFYPGFFKINLGTKKTLDFIGLNYYTRDFVNNRGLRPPGIFGHICTLDHHRHIGKRNFLSWEIYPKGLYDLLKDFSRYGLPLLITENGICTDNDEERREFIAEHLAELARAMREGVHVLGYLHWSLLDNFEWAEGFAPRFGLVDVDFKTQERSVRESARYFAEICKNGRIEMNRNE